MNILRLLLLMLVISNSSFAQVNKDFLGTWTFQKIDTVNSKNKIPKALEKSLISMTRTMQLTLFEDRSYISKVMGNETTGEYGLKGDKLITDNNIIIDLISQNQIYCSSKEYISFYMSKGIAIPTKKYKYLLSAAYDKESVRKSDLLGNWKVLEGRVEKDTPEASKSEGIATMLGFNFQEDALVTMKVMNIDVPTKYKFILKGNDLQIIHPSSKIEDYVVYLANEERLILFKKEDSMFLYLVPNLEEEEKESDLLPLNKNYIPIEFDETMLFKKWSCVDARLSKSEENPELAKSIFKSFIFTFEPNNVLLLEFFGVEQDRIWKKGESTGELFLGVTRGKPTLYIVNELSEQHLILTLGKSGTVLYFKPTTE